MGKLRAGIIGLGFIGKLHLDALRRVPYAEIIALCDADSQTTKDLCKQHRIICACTDWRTLMADPRVEVVHNCTPNCMHDEINRCALLAGKHLYSEKPLSGSASQARSMLELAVRQGVAHGLNHQYRVNAVVQEMRARLQKGLAGRPLMAYGCYLQETASRQTDWSPRMENTGPARTLNDIGVHWVDTAECVLGQPIKDVMADLIVHHPVRTGADRRMHAMTTEDTALILMHFMDGTPGQLLVSKAANGHKNDLRLLVACEAYEMEWRQEEPDRLYLGLKEEGTETVYMNVRTCQEEVRPFITTPMGHVMGWTDALHNALSVFYDAILNGSYQNSKQTYATFEDGFRGMAFVEACIRSNRERCWVEVERL